MEELPPVACYRVRNWKQFQHYKRGMPPWVKLHRALLDDREWGALSDAAARLLVEVWLVASEGKRDGEFPADAEWLAWRVRRPSGVLAGCLQELVKAGFLMEIRGVSSVALAVSYPRDRAETEQRQSRAEQTSGTCDECGRPLKLKNGRLEICHHGRQRA